MNDTAMDSSTYIKQLKEEVTMWRVKYFQAMGALGHPTPCDIPESDIKCGLCESKERRLIEVDAHKEALVEVIKIIAAAR